MKTLRSIIGCAKQIQANTFKMVNTCIDEAKKCGLNAWLYDKARRQLADAIVGIMQAAK